MRLLVTGPLAFAALGLLILGPGAGAQHEPEKPLDILFILNLPVLTDFTLSPDEKGVAVGGHHFGRNKVWVVPGGEEEAYLLADAENVRNREPAWSPNGKEIAFVSDRSGAWDIFTAAPDGSALRPLTATPGEERLPRWSPDGKWLCFLLREPGAETGWDLAWVSSSEGTPRRLSAHPLDEDDPQWSPDGRQIAYTEGGGRHGERRIALVSPAVEGRGASRQLLPAGWGGDSHSPRWSPDGKRLAFASDHDGLLAIYIVDVEGGTPRRLSDSRYEQTDPAWSPDGSEIAFVSNEEGNLRLMVGDVESGQSRRFTLGGGVFADPRWSSDGTAVFSFYEGSTYPRDVWFFEKGAGRRRLTDTLFRELDVRQMIRPEPVSYESFDGRRISGFLYLPHAVGPQAPVPLIVHPHEGPTAQWQDGWYPWVQLLAQKGYAVVVPNVRGSSGFGKEFAALNDRDWGRGDLEDLVAGARVIAARPEIRGEAVGIWGVGYGGFLTLAAIIRFPDLFAGAIEALAVPDLTALYRETSPEGRALLDRELGPLGENTELYRDLSLIHQADRIKTPLLSFHGEAYAFAPYAATKKPFVDTLRARGFPVLEWVFRGDMGRATRLYYLYPAPTNFYLEKMLEFWETYLPH